MDCREKVLSDEVYDYITDFPVAGRGNDIGSNCYADIENLYQLLYIDRAEIPNRDVSFFAYQSIPKLYGLMQTDSINSNSLTQPGTFDPTSLIAGGITRLQRPPLSLTGRGVVICVIDTGIDYQNPVFLDESGDSRILAIWDQTLQNGTPPEGFLFGTEYGREEINRALRSENPLQVVPSRDENGHGTALAAVAAGSSVGGREPYRGAAPEADLVIVKLKECKHYLREFYLLPEGVPAYQENDIMLAVQYADSFAVPFGRPVVICLGLGTNMGDHTGSSALSGYLNVVAVRRSRAVVVCGGNEGNAAHHYRGRLEQGSNGRDDGQDVEVRVGENARGFWLELWGNLPDVFNVELRSPGGERVPVIRLTSGQILTYALVYERSRITIKSVLVEPASGEQLILFRLEEPTAGIWTFRVFAAGRIHNGVFDMWLPLTQFMNTETAFLRPNPYTTLTEPAMAANVIGVSAYNAYNNSFYLDSGRGFDRRGAVRPDFAAPAVNIPTPSGERSGSSLAAAITAGAVAQFLQWAVVEQNAPFAESREIKSFLIRGATRSADTNYPNREWGYGSLNMEGVFETISGV